MVFYFSGTGNSKWVAKYLAQLINDEAFDIIDLKQLPNIYNEKQIGFVFPIYAWGIPEPMALFAKKLMKNKAFVFGVCTCGEDAGLAMKHFSKIYPLDSSYSIVMPNNYVIGYDIEDEQTIKNKLTNAKIKLQSISNEIKEQRKTYNVQEGSHARIKSSLVNFGFNKVARNTKSFYTTDACSGCSVCVNNCPKSSISLKNGKPVWEGQCYMCMRCINECPQQAIQYGKYTENRKRYSIKKYLEEDK